MSVRVRIVGAGAVCAAGANVDEVLAGTRPAPEPIDGVVVAPFDPRDLPNGIGRRLGRQPALALAAVLDALRGSTPDPDTALVFGTAHGAMSETIEFIGGAARHGPAAASPLLFAGSLHNAMAGAIGRALGLRGPAIVLSNGDASFEAALVVATAMIRNGSAARVIVGASDAMHPVFADGLRRMGLVPRPGGAAFPAAEGGGALVLASGRDDAPSDAADDLPGVEVAHAAIGGDEPSLGRVSAVAWLASGERRSVARHREAATRLGLGGVAPDVPAARFGTFGSLGAVATAVEAARRLRMTADPGGASVLLQAPLRAPLAVVALSGHGPA